MRLASLNEIHESSGSAANARRRSAAFDLDFFREPAGLAHERQLLELAAEQDRRDSGDDQFRSAISARCRAFCFGRQSIGGHVFFLA